MYFKDLRSVLLPLCESMSLGHGEERNRILYDLQQLPVIHETYSVLNLIWQSSDREMLMESRIYTTGREQEGRYHHPGMMHLLVYHSYYKSMISQMRHSAEKILQKLSV